MELHPLEKLTYIINLRRKVWLYKMRSWLSVASQLLLLTIFFTHGVRMIGDNLDSDTLSQKNLSLNEFNSFQISTQMRCLPPKKWKSFKSSRFNVAATILWQFQLRIIFILLEEILMASSVMEQQIMLVSQTKLRLLLAIMLHPRLRNLSLKNKTATTVSLSCKRTS